MAFSSMLQFAILRQALSQSLRTLTYRHLSTIRQLSQGNAGSHFQRSLLISRSISSSQVRPDEILRDVGNESNSGTGVADKREFQAETSMLLDIVAKSLYSDKEIFIRELISNSSDALEKLRYVHATGQNVDMGELQINITTDKMGKVMTIADTGIGMTKQEIIDNLGTIARSGSKKFLEQFSTGDTSPANVSAASNIIGQFGVGFYSCFMVSDKVEVITKSREAGAVGYRWSSQGKLSYEIEECETAQPGTKIILHLKAECLDFADEDIVKKAITRYSNFVNSPIYLNGHMINTIQALWLREPKDVSKELHDEFYKFVSNSAFDRPRFVLHYHTDAPVHLRCLLYVPEMKPGLFDLSKDGEAGVSLYCRRVLLKNKAEILPKWLRFVKGVVDSDDLPLNLSRELLQSSSLIRRISTVLTNRILRHLYDQQRKKPEEFAHFYSDYGLFFKEGIVSSNDQLEKEEIAKLLCYESSTRPSGEKVTIAEYAGRMKEGQNDIYYLAAPSRALAESSPYFEAVRKEDVEVLFCFEPYDELVLLQLRQFDRKNLISVEKEMRRSKEEEPGQSETSDGGMSRQSIDDLSDWLKASLLGKVHQVKSTNRLTNHACIISVEEMGAARHFVKTQALPEEERFKLLEPTLVINPKHVLIRKLDEMRTSNPELARLVAVQLFSNAMVTAGLLDDARTVVANMNELLAKALEKF